MGDARKIKPRSLGVDFNVGTGYSGRKNFSTGGIPSVQNGGHVVAELRAYKAFQWVGSGAGDKYFRGYEFALKVGSIFSGFGNTVKQKSLPVVAVQPFTGMEFNSAFFVDTHNTTYNFSCGPKVGVGYVADVPIGGGRNPVKHGVYGEVGAIFLFGPPDVAQRRSWGPRLELGARVNVFPKKKGLHAIDWLLTLTARFN